MKIERTPEFISFSFDARDWRDGDVGGFIAALKAQVPAWQRSYDETTRQWRIEAGYADLLARLRNTYLVDRRQRSLFDQQENHP
ncbi:MAG TPA: hypothetical protein VNQ79_18620 [Blastocatellia bacterium]|nr:hypothetical protein [Blastocatellia bacterium]